MEFTKDEALVLWLDLRESFKKMWFYEANKLLNVNTQDINELADKISSLPNFIARIKEWLKVLISGKILFFPKDKIIRQIFTASPRFLIYKEAVLEYLTDNGNEDKRSQIIKKWDEVVK